jgi:hypothetical protein
MNPIPETREAAVIRTDFSDDAKWNAICAEIEEPVGDFKAYVEFVNDPEYSALTPEQILLLVPPTWHHSFLFIVDAMSLSHPDHPILVIDLYTDRGRTFRVIPREMWGVENNLSLANMDFVEFAESVEADGIFRGFPET